MKESEMKVKLWEVFKATIYHGRHFSKSRDDIVIRKDVDYIIGLFRQAVRDDMEDK